MRWITALSLGAALALGLSFSASTEAEAKRAAKSKACVATNPATKKKISWRCAGNETCCYNATTNKASCSPASPVPGMGNICL